MYSIEYTNIIYIHIAYEYTVTVLIKVWFMYAKCGCEKRCDNYRSSFCS